MAGNYKVKEVPAANFVGFVLLGIGGELARSSQDVRGINAPSGHRLWACGRNRAASSSGSATHQQLGVRCAILNVTFKP